MTVSSDDWGRYIARLSAVNRKASQLMQGWMDANPGAGSGELIRAAYDVSGRYGEAAASLACEMYDALAEAQGAAAPPAEPAPTATFQETAKAVMGAVKNGRSTVPATVGRLTKQAGADTMLKNARRDGAEWAWVPRGDTCAFCITLASRGWQKASKKALNGGHAEHIHANCDCEYAVRFDGKSTVEGYDPEKYLKMYREAEGNSAQEKINSMRQAQYAANKDEINARKREKYAESKEKEEAAAASTAFLNKGDRLYENSKNIKEIDGFEDIVTHGDTVGLSFRDADGNESPVTPREFADILKKSGLYHGGNIRLIACEAGKEGALTAQLLANELGVRVMAPTDTVYVYPDGEMFVSSNGLTRDGKWVIFEPEKNDGR